jgi:hypothetical protein
MAGERLGCFGVNTDLSRDEFPSLLVMLLRRQVSIMLQTKEAVEASWTLPLKFVVVASPSEERLDLRDCVSGRRDRDRLSLWKLLVRTIKACGTTGEVQNGLHISRLPMDDRSVLRPKYRQTLRSRRWHER